MAYKVVQLTVSFLHPPGGAFVQKRDSQEFRWKEETLGYLVLQGVTGTSFSLVGTMIDFALRLAPTLLVLKPRLEPTLQ